MQQQVLENRELSREELIALRNKRTGVTICQISWIMVFICLVVVNLQLRSNSVSWPPPGVPALEKVMPTLATVALLVSTWFTRGGLLAIQQEKRESFRSQWRLAIGLGAAFILIMAYEWAVLPVSGQFSDVFRLMVAYHAIHAVVIGYIMIRVYGNAAAYDSLHNWAVEATTKLWYFVTIAWILFYVVLYLI